MYIDAKPTSTLGKTTGWTISLGKQPLGTMENRPALKQASSSSLSLAGMEQAVPSFQKFVKHTAPINQCKPLPPIPRGRRRSSHSGISRGQSTDSPSSSRPRRTSSVYSRTMSGWQPSDTSRGTDDYANEAYLLLRPIAYSVSTPQLVEKPATPPLLQPTVYTPPQHRQHRRAPVITPSPATSRASSRSPTPPTQPRPSILLPDPPESPRIPKKHLRTVSLEQAKAASRAPGVEHLLPEEMRARVLGKSRSFQSVVRDSTAKVMQGAVPTSPPTLPVLTDSQGRERALASTTINNQNPFKRYSRKDEALHAWHVGTFHASDHSEPRGRRTTRGSYTSTGRKNPVKRPPQRIERYGYDVQQSKFSAPYLASEYHTLLSEQPARQPSSSPAASSTMSDKSVRDHMKMVPRPLFTTKPPTRLPSEDSRRRYDSPFGSSVSPFGGGSRNSERGWSSDSRYSSQIRESKVTSLRLSKSPDSSYRYGKHASSTNGSIPISPPPSKPLSEFPKAATRLTPPPIPVTNGRSNDKRSGKSDRDKRVSAYYPYVAKRKGKRAVKMKSKPGLAKNGSPESQPRPLLAADIIAQRDRASYASSGISTPDKIEADPINDYAFEKGEESRLPTARRTIGEDSTLTRVVKGAVKYADILTRPATMDPPRSRPSNGELPHLVSVARSHNQAGGLHFGWSSTAKHAFDSVHLSALSTTKKDAKARSPDIPQHDYGYEEENEDEATTARRPSLSLFAFTSSFLHDARREHRAERRRKELKKSIKLVGVNGQGLESKNVPSV